MKNFLDYFNTVKVEKFLQIFSQSLHFPITLCHFSLKCSSAIILIAVLSGCVTNPKMSDSTVAQSHPKLLEEKKERKEAYDKPAEAQQFFASQRMPQGAKTLDFKLYENAQKQAASLKWYSTPENQMLDPTKLKSLKVLSPWQSLGPGNIGGRTRVLRFQPGNPNVMFAAGAVGGVWKSINAGQSWQPLTDLLPNLAVSSMAIDQTNPQRMWIGTGEGVFNIDAVIGNGIYITTDGGMNWTRLGSTDISDFFFVNDLIQSPNNPNALYAATQRGVWRSLDSGTSWTQVINTTSSGHNLRGGCFSLVVRTDTANTVGKDVVYAACGTYGLEQMTQNNKDGIVFRNLDALGSGAWESKLTVSNMGRTSLAIAKSNQNIVYALVAAGVQTGGNLDDGLRGVWRTSDNGQSWQAMELADGSLINDNDDLLLSNPLRARLDICGYVDPPQFRNQGWYDNVMAVDPTNFARVWVGGIDLWRSDTGGTDWGVGSYWWFDITDPNYAHADQHQIVFHPQYDGVNNKTLYVTNDGGIYRTDNATAAVGIEQNSGINNSICGEQNKPAITWTHLNNGYAVTQFYHGAVYPDGKNYFGGAQDNGTVRGSDATGPNAWTEISGGDGGFVAIDPSNTQILYVETTGISIEKSTNGGQTFTPATNGIVDIGSFINPFIMDPNNPSRLWTGGSKLWRTNDGAGSWSQVTNVDLPGANFSAFAVARYLPNLLLVGNDDGQIYRLTTATTASQATPMPFQTPRAGVVSSLVFDPTQTNADPNKRTAIATYSTFNAVGDTTPHVFKSIDGGQTWVGIDGMAPNALPNIPVNTVVIDPTTSNTQRIFVGTDMGVFVTTNGGTSWARENSGFANTVVSHLTMQYSTSNKQWELFAFTHGRGVYKTTVPAGDYIFANGFE